MEENEVFPSLDEFSVTEYGDRRLADPRTQDVMHIPGKAHIEYSYEDENIICSIDSNPNDGLWRWMMIQKEPFTYLDDGNLGGTRDLLAAYDEVRAAWQDRRQRMAMPTNQDVIVEIGDDWGDDLPAQDPGMTIPMADPRAAAATGGATGSGRIAMPRSAKSMTFGSEATAYRQPAPATARRRPTLDDVLVEIAEPSAHAGADVPEAYCAIPDLDDLERQMQEFFGGIDEEGDFAPDPLRDARDELASLADGLSGGGSAPYAEAPGDQSVDGFLAGGDEPPVVDEFFLSSLLPRGDLDLPDWLR